MSPPNIQFIGASGLGLDWDTYENGVWYEPYFIDRDGDVVERFAARGYSARRQKPLKAATTNYSQYDFTVENYPLINGIFDGVLSTGAIAAWGDDSNKPVVSVFGSGTTTYTQGVEVPWGWAVWDLVDQEWKGVAEYTSTGSNRHFATEIFSGHESVTHPVLMVSLTDDPGDISGWRDYDGPDDWDTWEGGIVRSVTSGGNYLTTTLKEVPGYSLSRTVGSFSSDSSVNYIRCLYLPNNGEVPFVALWNLDTGSWGLYEHQGVGDTYYDSSRATFAFHSGTHVVGNGVNIIVVVLTRQPNDITTWRDYDGPLYTGWDDLSWSYYGLAAGPGGDSSLGTFSIPIHYATGDVVGATKFTRQNTYRFDTQGTQSMSSATKISTYGTVWQVWYQGQVGWIRNGPVTNQYAFTGGGTYPYALNYGTFYDTGPLAYFETTEDPGETHFWPAYDGPVANWDTYANGVFIATDVGSSTSSTVFEQIPSYPSTTYTNPTTSIWTDSNSPVTNGFYFEDNQYDPTQNTPDSQKPPYIAVYVHEYSADGDFGDMPPGWYVFENYDQTFRPRGRTTWEKPVAWPTPSGNYNYYSNVIDTGYMGNVNEDGSGVIYVFLDEYNDPVGSGGTDHWTKPPFVISSEISTIDLSNQLLWLGLGSSQPYYETYNGITDFGFYHYQPIRNLNWLVRDMSGYGTVDIEVYHDSLLVGTGTWNATVGDGVHDLVSFANLVGYASQADFYNSVAVNDRMWFIAYYND